MKKLLFITDNITNKISYYHLVLLMLSLPFDRFYAHLIIISFAVHSFIHLKKTTFKWDILMLQAIFFVTLCSTIYSTNRSESLSELSKQLTILVLPILFCINELDLKKYKNNILTWFSIGCTITTIYLYTQAILAIRYYHLSIDTLFSPAFMNHNFSEPIGIHATYFAILLSIAFVYFLSLLIKEKSKPYFLLLLLCCLILLLGIVQLSSKAVLLTLLFIVNFSFPLFLLKGVKRLKFLVVTLSISLLLLFGIYKIDSFKKRYLTELGVDLSKSSQDELNDPRLARWNVAFKVAMQSPIIGHGAGTEIALLRKQFYEKKFYQSFLAKLNAHNQYLSFLITAGILGLMVYLYNLYFGFKTAMLNKDHLFFTFMVLITVVSLSENILFVDKGITIYSIFFTLFYFSNRTLRQPN